MLNQRQKGEQSSARINRGAGTRFTCVFWTQSVPSLHRVLGEVEKQKQLLQNNEILFGEFKHLKWIKQFDHQSDTNI